MLLFLCVAFSCVKMAHFLLVGIYEPVSFCCVDIIEFQLKRCVGSVAFSLSQLGAGQFSYIFLLLFTGSQSRNQSTPCMYANGGFDFYHAQWFESVTFQPRAYSVVTNRPKLITVTFNYFYTNTVGCCLSSWCQLGEVSVCVCVSVIVCFDGPDEQHSKE